MTEWLFDWNLISDTDPNNNFKVDIPVHFEATNFPDDGLLAKSYDNAEGEHGRHRLMREIPHLPSFRTQFVNLSIDDGQGPVNYGLFTHVERENQLYLKRRGLDDKGRLYKANYFRFQLASSPAFESDSIVAEFRSIADQPEPVFHSVNASQVPAGKHYARLVARVSREPERFWQIASNTVDVNGTIYYGIVEFEANP